MLPRTEGMTVSIRDLMDVTGEPHRAVVYWADLKILKALPGTDGKGPGFHRAFLADPFYGERVWALLASALNRIGVRTAHLKLIIGHLRQIAGLDQARDAKAARSFRASPFYRALVTNDPCLMLVRVDEKAKRGEQIRIRFLPPVRPEMLKPLDSGITGRSPSLEENARLTLEFLAQCGGRAHIVDLAQIFAPLRKAGR